MRVMFRFFLEDIQDMPKPNQRLISLCIRGEHGRPGVSNASYMINSLNLLTIALTDSQSYDIVFLLLSALYRC
jgi:hypothetical protein